MRKFLGTIVGGAIAVSVCAFAGSPAVAAGATCDRELLPVITSEQYAADDHDLVRDPTSGAVRLRFANAIGNRGTGPLEVHGLRSGASPRTVPDLTNDTMPAFQRIFCANGAHTDYAVGELAYHPVHHHFHFEGAVSYTLTDVASGAVVATSSKVSFCLADVDVINVSLASHPRAPVYNSCIHDPYTNDLTMGVSIGWADNYPKDVAGQNFDVTALMALPVQNYRMTAVVNPLHLLHTAPTSRTSSSFVVRLGRGVTVGVGIERPGV